MASGATCSADANGRSAMDEPSWNFCCVCLKVGGYPLNDLNAQMLTLFFWEGYYSLLGKLGRSIFRSTLKFPGLGGSTLQ
jgi:hypothetical protein